MADAAEGVVVQRTGEVLQARVAADKLQLYVDDWTADLRAGDVVGIRGTTRRVTVEPEVWTGAGLVATYEPASVLLPDLGQLLRASTTSAPVLDEDTGGLTFPDADLVWTGPCLAEAANAKSHGLEDLGDQRIGIIGFLVSVPLSLVDVRSGDQFKVTQSRDARLLVRLLTVTAVRASSTSLVRELVAFDNQGKVSI